LASEGNPTAIDFPRAIMHDGLDVSFSGLKTSVINYVRKNPNVSNADIAASFQEAVVDVLCSKTIKAAQQVKAKGIVLGGGVSANSSLRAQMTQRGAEAGFKVALPSRAMCTDNAAMIASAAWHRLKSDGPMDLTCGAYPNLKLSDVPR
jgi:N6-L-threonylcarbamoyladenine synthase